MTADTGLRLEREGGVGLVTLDRPKAHNSLTLAMFRVLEPGLIAWSRDPSVHAVLVRGGGDRAFCAGGDVRALYDARPGPGGAGPGALTSDFFREEYRLIRRIHRLSKPYIALIDGITMGGGAGISINGAYAVATERTVFAMPETAIGLFPDVGATRYLDRCPGRIGRYLALTGVRLKAADLLHCGLATHYVTHDRLPALHAGLGHMAWRPGDERAQVEAAIAVVAGDPGPPPIAGLRPAIDRCFAADSVEEIAAALADEPGAWAQQARDALARASPTSLKITLRQMVLGRGMDIEGALALEYRMTQHVMVGHDFYEGVRAALVDKDQAPRWRPARLAEVGEAAVEACFAGLGEGELRFD